MKTIVFVKPLKFEDTKKIVSYIIDDQILHLNLTATDEKTRQRIIDFIAGTIYLKKANLLNPEKYIYVSIPKETPYSFQEEEEKNNIIDEDNDLMDLRYNEEEEIKAIF